MIRAAVILGTILLWPSAGKAERPFCDAGLRPIAGSAGYGWRGNRCEGLYVSPISAHGLELVSLVQGELRFDLSPDTAIRVAAPEVSEFTRNPVNVRAVALPFRIYYRMDAILSDTEPLRWPVRDVLLSSQLDARRIGIFGWVETDNGRLFVPIRIAVKSQGPGADLVKLTLRSSVNIATVRWRSWLADAIPSSPPQWRNAASRPLRAGHPIAIILPPSAPGVLHVEVAAQGRDSDQWYTLDLDLLRPASP